MYIKINDKNIELKNAINFRDRIKSLKFVLGPLQYGIRFPNKAWCNTYFLFENVDIVQTDANENILYIFKNVYTERFIRKRKNVVNTYFLPVGCSDYLEDKDKIVLMYDENKKD